MTKFKNPSNKTLQRFSYEMYMILKNIKSSIQDNVDFFSEYQNSIFLYDMISDLFFDMIGDFQNAK